MSSETGFKVQDHEKRIHLLSQGNQKLASEPAQRRFPNTRAENARPAPLTLDSAWTQNTEHGPLFSSLDPGGTRMRRAAVTSRRRQGAAGLGRGEEDKVMVGTAPLWGARGASPFSSVTALGS